MVLVPSSTNSTRSSSGGVDRYRTSAPGLPCPRCVSALTFRFFVNDSGLMGTTNFLEGSSWVNFRSAKDRIRSFSSFFLSLIFVFQNLQHFVCTHLDHLFLWVGVVAVSIRCCRRTSSFTSFLDYNSCNYQLSNFYGHTDKI